MRPMMAFLWSLILFVPVSAMTKGPIIAVFDMEDKGSGLDTKVLRNLTDYLGVLLTQGGYRVVPSAQLRDRIKAQKSESHKSCYDQRCQIELGRELAAEKILATWVLKIGNTCQVTATQYDLKKGTTELAAVHEANCDETNLLAAAKVLAHELCKGLENLNTSAEEAHIKAAVARKEAEAARREARQKAEALEKMRRQVEATRKSAEEAETARLAAQLKLQELARKRASVNADELKKARLEAHQAKQRAELAEAESKNALARTAQLEQAKTEAMQAKERATLAEKERQLAENAKLQAERRAEEASLRAEEFRKYPQGRPTERYNVGIGIVGIAPDITEMKLANHQQADRTGTYQGGFGIAINADFMLSPYVSTGGYLAYTQGEFQDPNHPNAEDEYLDLHIVAVLATLKARLNLGPVEFRPGIAAGYQHLNGSAAGKVHGLGLAGFVQTAFFLGRHFALTLDLVMNFYPLATGSDGDQTYTTPLFYFTLGAEYCDYRICFRLARFGLFSVWLCLSRGSATTLAEREQTRYRCRWTNTKCRIRLHGRVVVLQEQKFS